MSPDDIPMVGDERKQERLVLGNIIDQFKQRDLLFSKQFIACIKRSDSDSALPEVNQLIYELSLLPSQDQEADC